MRHSETTPIPNEQPFAVLLNSRAKRVDENVEQRIREIVSPEDVFTSHSFDESQAIMKAIMNRGYTTVFAGGGDGTITHFIDSARRFVERENTWYNLLRSHEPDADHGPYRMPDIGILKLGTGNALASVVGSTDYLTDLRIFVEGGFRDHIELSLIESANRRFAFAGVGWDAQILNEYKALKERYESTPMKHAVENLGGYFAAFFLRFMPKQLVRNLKNKKVEARIIATAPTTLLGEEGRRLREYQSGDVIYDGPCNLAIVGTQPYYGYGFKVLPFSDRYANRFQLRIVRQGMLKTLSSLRPIWKGTYYNPNGILDFATAGVRLQFSEDVPSHIAGDADRAVNEIEYSLASQHINLLDYN
ncbi:MAG: hypothetical protein KC609_09325 [Myxococcales bacterium]|nr:hypothetical protein [Myxococcales bacterium]